MPHHLSWLRRDIGATEISLIDSLDIINQPINQSINQSNFYSANIPGEVRLSGATAKSVFNSKIEEQFRNINRP